VQSTVRLATEKPFPIATTPTQSEQRPIAQSDLQPSAPPEGFAGITQHTPKSPSNGSDAAASSLPPISAQSLPKRPKFIFRPAVPAVDSAGNAVLRPDVIVTDLDQSQPPYASSGLPSLDDAKAPRVTTPLSVIRQASGSIPQPSPTRQPSALPAVRHVQGVSQVPHRLAQQTANVQPLPPPSRIEPQPSTSPEPPIFQESLPDGGEMMMEPMVEGMPGDFGMPGEAGMPYGEYGDHVKHGGPVACGDGVDEGWGHDHVGGPLGRALDSFAECLHGPPCYQGALGVERVMHAPFFIDTTQPLQNCRVRFDFGWDEEFPDRAEYFWPKTPDRVRPDVTVGEPSVDYQDIRFYIERGTKQFSVATELPLRIVDPEIRRNSAGFGDMNLTTKAVLLDGRKWQLAQLFRTYFPTGSTNSGRGNGHFSFEPGVAYRYKFSDITYFHGDLKYWFPVGVDPTFAGEFLNYGIGVSHVAVDRDCFAVIPTLELVAWTVLDGAQTPPGPVPQDPNLQGIPVDNMSIVNLCPGVRFVWENGNDCNTRELGISAGVALSDDHWYESLLRVELRWSF
jgi:hypothetical protein